MWEMPLHGRDLSSIPGLLSVQLQKHPSAVTVSKMSPDSAKCFRVDEARVTKALLVENYFRTRGRSMSMMRQIIYDHFVICHTFPPVVHRNTFIFYWCVIC